MDSADHLSRFTNQSRRETRRTVGRGISREALECCLRRVSKRRRETPAPFFQLHFPTAQYHPEHP